MMFGGGMMFGVGLLLMLVVVGLPLLIVMALVAAIGGRVGRRNRLVTAPPVSGPLAPVARYCSHCGQGLQLDWTHCPQCGAAVTG